MCIFFAASLMLPQSATAKKMRRFLKVIAFSSLCAFVLLLLL